MTFPEVSGYPCPLPLCPLPLYLSTSLPLYLSATLSPCLPVSLSPCLSVSLPFALLLCSVSLLLSLSLCRCPFLLSGFQPFAVSFCPCLLLPCCFSLAICFLASHSAAVCAFSLVSSPLPFSFVSAPVSVLAFASFFPFSLLLCSVSLRFSPSLCRCLCFSPWFSALCCFLLSLSCRFCPFVPLFPLFSVLFVFVNHSHLTLLHALRQSHTQPPPNQRLNQI